MKGREGTAEAWESGRGGGGGGRVQGRQAEEIDRMKGRRGQRLSGKGRHTKGGEGKERKTGPREECSIQEWRNRG